MLTIDTRNIEFQNHLSKLCFDDLFHSTYTHFYKTSTFENNERFNHTSSFKVFSATARYFFQKLPNGRSSQKNIKKKRPYIEKTISRQSNVEKK